MKVLGLDNKPYTFKFSDYIVHNDDTTKRSSLHLRTRNILQAILPLFIVCEEVPLPGTKNLKFDFFLPALNLAIECQGEQHFKFIRHFHGTIAGFLNCRKRDKLKKEWCELNNIQLCELSYDESDEQWRKRIISGQCRDTTSDSE